MCACGGELGSRAELHGLLGTADMGGDHLAQPQDAAKGRIGATTLRARANTEGDTVILRLVTSCRGRPRGLGPHSPRADSDRAGVLGRVESLSTQVEGAVHVLGRHRLQVRESGAAFRHVVAPPRAWCPQQSRGGNRGVLLRPVPGVAGLSVHEGVPSNMRTHECQSQVQVPTAAGTDNDGVIWGR